MTVVTDRRSAFERDTLGVVVVLAVASVLLLLAGLKVWYLRETNGASEYARTTCPVFGDDVDMTCVRRVSTVGPVELAPLPFAASIASGVLAVGLLTMLARRRPSLRRASVVGMVLLGTLIAGVLVLNVVGGNEPPGSDRSLPPASVAA